MGHFSRNPKDPKPNPLLKPYKRGDESPEEYNRRLADWKAGKDPLAGFKESYKNASHGEREEFHEQVGGILSLLGMKDNDVEKLQKIVDPKPRTNFADKARQLDTLQHDYEDAIAEHPEQAEMLKTLYEAEKQKILNS